MHRDRRNWLFRLWPVAAIVAVAVVLAGVLVPLAAHADTIALSGTVQNANGTKLGGVTVTALPYGGSSGTLQSTVSSSSGAFAFPALFQGSYTLSFGATSTTFAQYLGNTSLLANAETMEIFPGADAEDHSYINVTLSNSGTISGKVSKLPSGALADYTVRAFDQAADGTWSIVRSTKSTSTGAYSLTGLQPGGYALEAIDLTSAHPAYSPTFSGGTTTVDSATSVGVVANRPTTYNFSLGRAGSVSGSVVGIYDGTHSEVVPGTHVQVFRLDGYLTPSESATALDTPSATTTSTGAYSISGLAPGHYTLEFEPPSTPTAVGNQLYGRAFLGTATDRTDPLQAEVITIGNGTALTAYGISLAAQGEVSGTVESSTDSSPLPNIRVSIDYAGRDQDLPSEHAASMITGDDGAFSFGDLGPGDYDLWVGSTSYADPADTVFEDMTWVREVVNVPGITSGNTTVVPVTMTKRVGPSLYPTTFPTIDNEGTSVGDSASIGSNGVWTDSNLGPSNFTYQWTRDGKPIPFETNSVYNFKPGDVNHTISANVTATDFGYGTKTVEALGGINAVGPGTINGPVPAPSITGTDAVGHVLSVTPGAYDVFGAVITYDWQYYKSSTATWIDTGEPTTPTHLVTTSDWENSNSLRVVITASRDGYVDNIAYASPGGTTGQGTLTMVTPPTIKKSATAFSVVGGAWSPSAFDSIDYNWNVYDANGAQLATSGAATLPVAGTAGDYVTLVLRHNLQGYTSSFSPVITAQLGDPAVASGTTTFASTPAVGADIFAPTPTWAPSSGSTTYQWQYKYKTTWRNAAGNSTQNFYENTAADLGRVYRVVLTRHASGLKDAVLAVQASTTVGLGSADGTTVSPVVSGTYGTGDTVSTTTGTWLQPGGVYSYQWERTANFEFGPDVPIPGATKSTFVIPQSLIGDYLFVEVTSKVPGHHDGVRNGYLAGTPDTVVSTDKLTLAKAATVTHSGTVYTVKGGTFAPAATPGDTTYKWEYFDESSSTWVVASSVTPPAGTTSSSLDLHGTGHDGARWGVVVSGTAPGYTATDAPIVAVANGAITHPGNVQLPPSSTVDQPINAVQPAWSVTSPAIKYQWRLETTPSSNVWKNIAGATGPTFTATGAYVNRELDVVETASKAGYAPDVVITGPTFANAADAPLPGTSASAPSITGDDVVGSTLTAHPGTWNKTGLTFHYSWQVSTDGSSWATIPGATSASYLIPIPAIDTDYFQVTVTASKLGYENGTGFAATALTAGFGNTTEVTAPKVTSKNGVYTVTTGTWKPTPLHYVYVWTLYDPVTDLPTVVGTNSNTYTLQPGDSAKKLLVQVGVQVTYYTSTSDRLVAHAGAKIVSSTPPALSGTPVVGGDLTATFGTWSTPSPTVSAQWFANGVAQPGAGHGLTFHLGSADLGKTISAKFTVSLYGYTTAVYTAASTPVFSNQVLAPTVPPVISGSRLVDKTLTVSTGTWNTTGLSFAYRWLRNGRAIPGATGPSYVVNAADAGQEITAGVTASKANFTPVEFRPDEETIDDGDVVAYTGAPVTITNTPLVGNILTAKLGTFALPVTVQYSWFVNNGAGWVVIAGAHSNTYTVSAADAMATGSEIKVSILVERAGHTPESLDSVPVTVGISP